MAKLPIQKDPLETLAMFVKHATRIDLRSREAILPTQEQAAAVYLVETGTLSYGQVSIDKKVIHFGHLNRGDIFGESAFFSLAPSPGKDIVVTAKTDSTLLYLSHETLLKMPAQQQAELMVALCHRLDCRLQVFTGRIASMAFHDVSHRVHKELIELAGYSDAATHPEGMLVKISRKELSKLVSCSREVVGKVLTSLADLGLITVAGHSIVVRGTR